MPNSILESVTCQICLTMMEDPRALPCGHVFCLKCVHALYDNIARHSRIPLEAVDIQCPNRCTPIKVTKEGIDSFAKIFILNSIIDSINQTGVCQTHNDIMGFIDITNGKLSCADCLAAKIRPEAPSSDHESVKSIQSFAVARDTLKSSLTDLITRSKDTIAKLEEGVKALKQGIDEEQKKLNAVEKEINTIFDNIQRKLEDKRRKIQNDLANGIPQLTAARNYVSKLAAMSQCLQGAVSQVPEFLAANNIPTAHQASLVPFLRSGVHLQTVFTRKNNTALNILKSLHSDALSWRHYQISVQYYDVFSTSFCTFKVIYG
ncbi:hypothetical protein BC937DRAFT_88985 [Endogone sp. FLAS-F59071]|nr:hypothetical protein BC937DRAFT_88985 [Endogone sp. FLAS-F59071]|eukprot:RUS18251.1 hypothetical protein BC937DRAFT_88985 [Endogone sp. FLAS-F59071]